MIGADKESHGGKNLYLEVYKCHESSPTCLILFNSIAIFVL